jgi:hypothetical protein
MKRFEYRWYYPLKAEPLTDDGVIAQLNALGSEGWRVISNHGAILLMRELEEQKNNEIQQS